MDVKRETVGEFGLAALLVAIGVATRLAAAEWQAWYVSSVIGPALFAGYYFSRTWLAAAVPLAVMALSDLSLPAYDNRYVMLVTYVAVLLPLLLRPVLRRSLWNVVFCVVGSSLTFYLVTNLAHWYFVARFPGELGPGNSLWACYVDGLPFYKFRLMGDLTWSAVLFGSYLLATRVGALPAVETRLAEARVPVVRETNKRNDR
jgi:hypothetical protein